MFYKQICFVKRVTVKFIPENLNSFDMYIAYLSPTPTFIFLLLKWGLLLVWLWWRLLILQRLWWQSSSLLLSLEIMSLCPWTTTVRSLLVTVVALVLWAVSLLWRVAGHIPINLDHTRTSAQCATCWKYDTEIYIMNISCQVLTEFVTFQADEFIL